MGHSIQLPSDFFIVQMSSNGWGFLDSRHYTSTEWGGELQTFKKMVKINLKIKKEVI